MRTSAPGTSAATRVTLSHVLHATRCAGRDHPRRADGRSSGRQRGDQKNFQLARHRLAAVRQRDSRNYRSCSGIMVLGSLVVIAANVAVDLVYMWLDPHRDPLMARFNSPASSSWSASRNPRRPGQGRVHLPRGADGRAGAAALPDRSVASSARPELWPGDRLSARHRFARPRHPGDDRARRAPPC